MTSERYNVLDLSYPHEFVDISFTSPSPTITQFNDLLQPFDTYIWLSIVTTIATLMAINVIYNKVFATYKCNYYWTLFVICLKQTQCLPVPRYPVNMLLTIWMLMSTVLLISYSGTIYSLMTVPIEHRIETIDQLIDSQRTGELTIVVQKNSLSAYLLVRSFYLLV